MAELEDRNEKLEAKRRELQEEIQVRIYRICRAVVE